MSLPSSPQEMPVDGASSTVPSQGQFGAAAVKPLSALAVTALVLGIISLPSVMGSDSEQSDFHSGSDCYRRGDCRCRSDAPK